METDEDTVNVVLYTSKLSRLLSGNQTDDPKFQLCPDFLTGQTKQKQKQLQGDQIHSGPIKSTTRQQAGRTLEGPHTSAQTLLSYLNQ